MGLLDLFKKKSENTPKTSERDIARLERLVSTKLSQNFDRQDAIDQLGKMGTANAASALLKRFNWYLDPSITDQEEKEAAVAGIVAVGELALEPIRQYCRRAESLTWPLKALERIVPAERYLEELLTLLDQFDTEYVRNPEPKVQLITALEPFANDEVRLAVEPFFEDMSEPVRFAAVSTVFAAKSTESMVLLITALGNEESLRVRNRIALGLVETGWQIPDDLKALCVRSLPEGYQLAGNVVRTQN